MDTKQARPKLKYTPLDDIPETAKAVRTTFRSGRTRPIQYRLKQLRKFYWGTMNSSSLMLAKRTWARPTSRPTLPSSTGFSTTFCS
ncbi:hypothetical protein IWX48DRAFT_222254 [Phyllosticta citricarpa]